MTTQAATLVEQPPTVKMLLDGKFVESETSEWHDVVNPATQEVLAQVPFATDAEIDAAVASAKRALQDLEEHAYCGPRPHHAQAAGAGARAHEPASPSP